MTVRQLILELSELPLDALIVCDSNSDEYGEIRIEELRDEEDETKSLGYVLFDEKRIVHGEIHPADNEPQQLKLPFDS